jgi:hypothetical protein
MKREIGDLANYAADRILGMTWKIEATTNANA